MESEALRRDIALVRNMDVGCSVWGQVLGWWKYSAISSGCLSIFQIESKAISSKQG